MYIDIYNIEYLFGNNNYLFVDMSARYPIDARRDELSARE